ncbi:MAG TPA: Rv3235 family protein [Candidatus Nanopelagicales bacterium]
MQGTLALEWQLPGDVDAVPSPDRALRLVSRTPALDLDTDPAVAVVATSRADLPDPGPWTAQLVQAVLEVLAHERPRQQLVRWLAPEVYAGLGVHLAASPTRPAAGGAPSGRARRTVSSIHVSEPAEGSSRRAPWCSAAAAPVPSPYASRAGAADGGAPA